MAAPRTSETRKSHGILAHGDVLLCSRKVPEFQRCGLCTNNFVALLQTRMQSMTGRLVVLEQEFHYRVAKKATFETCRQACCSEASQRFGLDPQSLKSRLATCARRWNHKRFYIRTPKCMWRQQILFKVFRQKGEEWSWRLHKLLWPFVTV